MSYTQFERGKFIREKMGLLQLIALGQGEMTAQECGDLDDLVKEALETAGTTHNTELAKHPIYLKAVEAWGKARERRRKFYEQRRS